MSIIELILRLVLVPALQFSCNVCEEHCYKDESAPFEFNVDPEGWNQSYITRVEIKAGTQCHVFTADALTACYSVSGIGSKFARVRDVTEGGTPECPAVSHVNFHWTSPALTPTPTPTDLPPTLTPTPPTPTREQPPTVTNTPPPGATMTPTPTNTPVPTVTNTPPPDPTVTPAPPTSTPKPPPSVGRIRGFQYCVYPDGSWGQVYHELWIKTNNMGTLGGYSWPPDGFVGVWDTPEDVGTKVLDAGPGECFRGGDNWPEDRTEYDLQAQPWFGVANVGLSAVVCRQPCGDVTPPLLPPTGGARRFARNKR